MSKVLLDGQLVSVSVDHVGPQFNVWRLERQPRSYEVFCNQKGGVSVSFTDEDADALEADLSALQAGTLSAQALEDRLARKIYPFLQSVQS
ncbi:MAG: hypothetical protein ACKODU_05625 [Limnohabitans sp.]